jgi:hypothetical protein
MHGSSGHICGVVTVVRSLVAISILFIVGCATPEPIPASERFTASTPVKVVGDFDDIESAVRIGASQSEMAILETRRPSATVYEFDLLTITDEPARLRVEQDAEVGSGVASLTLSASVGRFGNRPWEERLIGRIARRLEALHGVDVAPLQDP